MAKVSILDIHVDVIDQPGLLRRIDELVQAARVAFVNNVNVHACNLAYEQPAFRALLNASDVVFCDGFGVKIGAWLAGKRLGQRMTPPDWVDDLFSLCVVRNYSVYFVGDEEAVVSLFVDELRSKYPDLRVAGFHHGFFALESAENERLMDEIREVQADVVITGMGMPRQEFWAEIAAKKLDKGVFIATGALFRWYTGVDRRAPRWMTDRGMEWLARLVMNPVRHFKRYVIGLPLFFIRIILSQRIFRS